MTTSTKIASVVGVVILVGVLYQDGSLQELFTEEGYANLKLWIEAQGFWAPLVYILCYLVGTLLFIPGSIMNLTAGAIFGTTWGFLYVVIASNIGASIAFFLVRHFGRDFAQKLVVAGGLANFQAGLNRNAFLLVLGLRLVPVIPFNPLNFVLGLSQVGWKDYALGTLLGMLPATFIYVTLGNVANTLHGARLTDPETLRRPDVWGPFLLVAVLGLLTHRFRRSRGQQLSPLVPKAPPPPSTPHS